MTNPFDKFDSPKDSSSVNPFDKLDDTKSPEAYRGMILPYSKSTTGEKSFAVPGLIKGIVDPLIGVYDVAEKLTKGQPVSQEEMEVVSRELPMALTGLPGAKTIMLPSSNKVVGEALKGARNLAASAIKPFKQAIDPFIGNIEKTASRAYERLIPPNATQEEKLAIAKQISQGDLESPATKAELEILKQAPGEQAAPNLQSIERPEGDISAPFKVLSEKRNIQKTVYEAEKENAVRNANSANAAAKAAYDERVRLGQESAKFSTNVNLEFAEKAAAKVAQDANEAAAKANAIAEAQAKASVGSVATGTSKYHAINKTDSSVEARSRIDELKSNDYDTNVTPAWNAAGKVAVKGEAPSLKNIVFNADSKDATGKTFKESIADYSGKNLLDDDKFKAPTSALDGTEQSYVKTEIWNRIAGLSSKSNLGEVQSIMSELNTLARNAAKNGESNANRILTGLAKKIFDGIDSNKTVAPADASAWKAARDATKSYYDKWGNFITGKYLEDQKLGSVASNTLQNFVLAGEKGAAPEKVAQLFKISTLPDGSKDPAIMSALSKYLGHDLADHLGDDFSNVKAIKAWQEKFSHVLEGDTSLGAKFDTVKSAVQTAADTAQAASVKQKAIQITAAQKKLMEVVPISPSIPVPVKPAYVQPIENIDNLIPKDVTNPKSIYGKMTSILESTDEDSMQNFVSQLGDDVDAVTGTKRILADLILDNESPHNFILTNRTKLHQVFNTPEEQAYLSKIEKDSFDIEKAFLSETPTIKAAKNKDIAALMSKNGFLSALLGRGAAITARVGTGIAGVALVPSIGGPLSSIMIDAAAGGVSSSRIANFIYNSPRERVLDIIKDGLLNPDRAKVLTTPIKPLDFPKIKKAYGYMLPLLIGNMGPSEPSKEQPTQPVPRIDINTSPKYAAGGPVYTHPAISSIRAKRAMRSFAR